MPKGHKQSDGTAKNKDHSNTKLLCHGSRLTVVHDSIRVPSFPLQILNGTLKHTASIRESPFGRPVWVPNQGVWVKIKPPGDRRFWSMFPLTRGPFWVHIFDPQPLEEFVTARQSRLKAKVTSPSCGTSQAPGGSARRQPLAGKGSQFSDLCLCFLRMDEIRLHRFETF